jgi:hypothetical protein
VSDTEDTPRKRRWIPRETYRQEGAVRFVRHAVKQPHEFFAFDRDKNDKDSHLWESRRGVRKATPDTLLCIPGPSNVWWEWKAGNNKPDDDQLRMIEKLRSLGDYAGWGRTIGDLCEFYRMAGVPMEDNAEYQALHHDGLVDSRIAKEEARQAGLAPPKKTRARKAPPRYAASKRMAKRIYAP